MQSFRDTVFSFLCLSRGFATQVSLQFQSDAQSADLASVSQERLPHHQRLQRGGGGWANVSQGLLRLPSTEKDAGGRGMEVRMTSMGGSNRWREIPAHMWTTQRQDTHRQTERQGLWHWGKSDGRQRREGRNRERRNIEKTCAVMPDCFAHSSLLHSHKVNTSQTATNSVYSAVIVF